MTQKAMPESPNAQSVAYVVYGVHAVRLREICATQFITANLTVAEQYAGVMSNDPGVLAAAVTRYVMDVEGQHRAAALYVEGVRQQVPHVSDDRRICANGHGSGSWPIGDR
ncbi:MAG: hypothetical protein M3Z25_08000 [Actinomycetota bacterium]|nr:hypothetical protein [Actinomycetota bacterium]